MADDRDNNNNGNDKEKDKVIQFPGNQAPPMDDDELDGVVYVQMNISGPPALREPKEVPELDPNLPLTDVIDDLAKEEVRRMTKSLYFLDFLEDELKAKTVESINLGTMDLITLQKIIGTVNKSVMRSNEIIKRKDSDLIQILVDARTQNMIQNQTNITSEDTSQLSQRSRKKLQKIIGALMAGTAEEEEQPVIEAEIIEDGAPDENT